MKGLEKKVHWHESGSGLDEFIELMEHSDIYQKLPNGDGRIFFAEALQIADHNSYHIAEIVAIRRILGIGKRLSL